MGHALARTVGSVALLVSLADGLRPTPALAQVTRRNEEAYPAGSFNWEFLRRYPAAARVFNAFDYGHAVLYELLLAGTGAGGRPLPDALALEFRYLTTDLLIRPPRFAIAEEAVMPEYAKAAWPAKLTFDRAHVLHRQIYDAYADERLTAAERDTLIERLTDRYLARDEVAFAAVPKSMDLMEAQRFSGTFRRRFPSFNGLIWAYHWLQVGLYEPFVEGGSSAARRAGVDAAVARFFSMVDEASRNGGAGFPRQMPMTAAIAPRFTEAHPRAAVIFDNLHMAHDIISDVLADDRIAGDEKPAEIARQMAILRDTVTATISLEEWRGMPAAMGGVGEMGGPATDLLARPAAAGGNICYCDTGGGGGCFERSMLPPAAAGVPSPETPPAHQGGNVRLSTTLCAALLVAGSQAAEAQAHAATGDHANHSTGPRVAPGSPAPTQPGQAAYGTIGEVVRLLEADPATDWTKVNIERLRRHLIEMDEVTMNAGAVQVSIPGGARITVTGTGSTREAIRRMTRAHASQFTDSPDIQVLVAEHPEGSVMMVTARRAGDAVTEAKIRGLGFLGLMTLGDHHGPHHLAMAAGQQPAGHGGGH